MSDSKRSPRWIILLAPIPLGLVALGVFFAARPSVSGRLAWTETGESRVFAPDGCESGFRLGFEGVRLEVGGKPDQTVELIRNPSGGKLARIQNGDRVHQVASQACTTFELELDAVRQTNHTISYAGSARIDCGPLLAGSVAFSGCHAE